MMNDEPLVTIDEEEKTNAKKAGKKVDVEFENTMSREEAVSYFEAIVAGLKKGRLHIKQGDQSLDLEPAQQVDVEVRASHKKGRERIRFEIAWREARESDLSISSE